LKNDIHEGPAGPDPAKETAEGEDRQSASYNVNFAQTADMAGRGI
jgi:hypothetical protein